ncbi:MAG: diacylglycerol kinase family protein [Clostridia bacterium]|nr:diacylglycerol kinase family protein [Clostridia bacterium]
MGKYIILYNPKSKSESGRVIAEEVKQYAGEREPELIDITKVDDYASFLGNIGDDDALVICGGDGTLNRFVNFTDGMKLPETLLFYSAGTGNDFYNDLGKTPGGEPIDVKPYIAHLPTVTVNGKTYKFINGIGYGIDGYCCEIGDKMREESTKPVNYASIAIKGLLFHYKPTNATVTVDGVKKTFKKVWIAPTMNGRYYGGGMIAAPDQDRMNNETVSTMLMYGKGRLKTLMVFPSIFKGEHVKHTEMVEVMTGREVTVEFDRPTSLQIDGETVLGVSSYSVKAYSPAPVAEEAAVL